MDNNLKVCLPLYRSYEPNFTNKDGYVFDIPSEYLASRYRAIGVDLENKIGGEEFVSKIPVKQIQLPDLTIPKQLDRNADFCLFYEHHRKMAEVLMKIFNDCESIDELVSTALYVRDQVNPYMFAYAYSVVVSHRKDTQDVLLPSVFEIFPTKLISKEILEKIREEAFIFPESLRTAVEIPRDFTATDAEPEHRVAYFREDIGVNSHHWHWHLVYPFSGPDPSFYDKDRRGELFYYMHNQIIARNNTERLCNDLKMSVKFDNLREIIEWGYYSKLNTTNASRNIPGRQANTFLADLKRDQDFLDIKLSDLERFRDRILEAIDRGYLDDDRGQRIQLDNDRGIDILGNVVEASFLSPNLRYFGNFHNDGHTVISLCHDPRNEHGEGAAVMGDTTTAMRDPIFYRWHSYLDEIFQQHKLSQRMYLEPELNFPGVRIENINFLIGDRTTSELITFWQRTDVNLGNGLDFIRNGAVLAKFCHINHEEFDYEITINNFGAPRMGTIRIFMAAVNNEAKTPFLFEGTRRISIEMDKFVVNLRAGINRIVRRSSESSVIIPFERTFPEIIINRAGQGIPTIQPQSLRDYCGCGWPNHLLVPKGTVEGYPCRLFVMVSDYIIDAIPNQDSSGACSDSHVFCGIRDKRYPDARSMGFPFDRPAPFNVISMEDFIRGRENMGIKYFTIRHIDEVLRYRNARNAIEEEEENNRSSRKSDDVDKKNKKN